jgi:gliding motility-associated-like protein
LCNGTSTGSIDLTYSGGTAPYQYIWNNSSTDEDLINVSAGTYSVIITDKNGCKDTISTVINEPNILSSSILATDVLCHGDATGSIDLTVLGGIPPYQFKWSNGSTDQNLINVPSGIYDVTVLDNNGCAISDGTSINQPNSTLSSSVLVVDNFCFADTSGSIDLSVFGGTGSYTYLWDTNPTKNTEDLVNLKAGNYTVTVTDKNNCKLTKSFTVNEPQILVAQAIITSSITINGGKASVTVSASGGLAPYSGIGTFNVVAGTHDFIVIDANGCKDTVRIIVTEPTVFVASASVTKPINCFGELGEILVSATGGTSPYMGTGYFNENQGTYSYIVTDFHGNKDTVSIILEEPAELIANSSGSDILCFGEKSQINVTAAGGTLPYSGIGQFLEGAGTYNYMVIDKNGCSDETTIVINEPDPIIISANIQNVLCQNGKGSIDLAVSGGIAPYKVTWNGIIISEDLFNISAGTYSVEIEDKNGCKLMDSYFVQNNFAPVPTINNLSGTSQLDCAIKSIELEVKDAITYSWSGGVSSGSNSTLFVVPNTYYLDSYDLNNCLVKLSATITQDVSSPIVTLNNITGTTELTCDILAVDVMVSGGISYSWSNNLGSSPNQTFTQPGTYTVTVIGSNSCFSSETITITKDNTAPVVTITNLSGTNTLNCNQSTINVVASGGATYSWSNNLGTNPNVSIANPGTYTVTAYANNGCSDTETITINKNQNPTVTVNTLSLCSGESGTLTAIPSVSGGHFVWTQQQTPTNVTLPDNGSSITVSPTQNTTYIVQYFDGDNCPSNSAQTVVLVTQKPVVTLNGNSTICSGKPALLTATTSVSGSGGIYTWIPALGSNSATVVTPLTTSTYSVFYTLNGCASNTASHTVNVNQTPTVQINNIGICKGETGTLTATPSEPGGSYTWNTTPVSTSQSIDVQPTTTSNYTVVYNSVNNCMSALTTATVTVTDRPTLEINDIDICEGKSGTLVATPSQPGGYFTWFPVGGIGDSYIVSPTASTTVSVYYTLNGCSTLTETANVNLIKTPAVSVSNIGICKGEMGTLVATPSVSGGIFTWSTAETTQTIHVTPTVTTQYSVIYSYKGCSSPLAQAIVSVDAIPTVTFDSDVVEGCSPLTVNFTNTTKNTQNCTWDFGNGVSLNECKTLSLTFEQAGCYDVTLTTDSPNGCRGSLTANNMICVHSKPKSNFAISTDIIGESNSTVYIQNTSENAVNYIWNYGDNEIDSAILNPISHTYNSTQANEFVISLIAISDFGCIDSTSKIIRSSNEIVLYAPNTFIPDDDGLNETWFPVISAGYYIHDYKLLIYNRWGAIVFQTEDPKQAWDGTFYGNKVQKGTYTYKILFRDRDNKIQTYIGHINLIR